MSEKAMADNSALEKFRQLVIAQGGNGDIVDDLSLLPSSKYVTVLKSKNSGYIQAIEASELGKLAMQLGAGRASAEEDINYAVGLELAVKVADYIEAGQDLITIYHDEDLSDAWIDELYTAYTYSEQAVIKEPIIYKVL